MELGRATIATVSSETRVTRAIRLASLALLWQIRFGWVDEEFLTVWASLRSRLSKEVEDGLPDRRHARLWRRSPDSFFSVPLL